MDKEAIIEELTNRYPGKTILMLPEEAPTEIICEIEPTVEHPERSLAVAIIKRSAPHVHRISTEKYKILQGVVQLHIGGDALTLFPGQVYTIDPGILHWAESVNDKAWVSVESKPGWTPEDHILRNDISEKV